MRKFILTSMCVGLLCSICNAQFYKAILPSQAFTDSLGKIVSSFRNNYYSIQGDIMSAQPDVDTYESKAAVPGTERSMLLRFHSVEDTTASWQAIMYTGDDYKEAAKIYKNTFRLVNKAHLTIENSSLGFRGEMEEPTESLRFTSSSLVAVSQNPVYAHFIAEIEMVNSFTGWEVHLNLHNKKDDRDKY